MKKDKNVKKVKAARNKIFPAVIVPTGIILIAFVITAVVFYRKSKSNDPDNVKYNNQSALSEQTDENIRNDVKDIPQQADNSAGTVINYDAQFNACISDAGEAREVIRAYGRRQRKNYSNPEVEKLELQMENDFSIMAVNLGEIDILTAQDIKKAFMYMYQEYPQLKGTLTNLTVGNFYGRSAGNIAVTQNLDFVINNSGYPFVEKYQIVLNASKFKNRNKMLDNCKEQVKTGYWPANTDISSIVVHELGHQLLHVAEMKKSGLHDAYYITQDNQEAYYNYISDGLNVNQTTARSIINQAYDNWKQVYHHEGNEEEFRGSISEYAKGIKEDGGVCYSETIAEAIADVYLNGENAADASKLIRDAIKQRL